MGLHSNVINPIPIPTEHTWRFVTTKLSECLNKDIDFTKIIPTQGGDISSAYTLTTNHGKYFVKVQTLDLIEIFHSELLSLNTLQPYCPLPIGVFQYENFSFLVMEYLDLSFRGDEHSLAELIAGLHSTENSFFGWQESNFIGLTRQENEPRNDWLNFWWDMRLLPQLQLAYQNGFNELKAYESDLLLANQQLLSKHHPSPALLHGDLWSGNKAFLKDKRAIIFDPASYYGDRETDIAMSELFGGFGKAFYQRYNEILPLEEGYEKRKPLYNLYHLLNHLNLFGRSYLAQCIDTIKNLNS